MSQPETQHLCGHPSPANETHTCQKPAGHPPEPEELVGGWYFIPACFSHSWHTDPATVPEGVPVWMHTWREDLQEGTLRLEMERIRQQEQSGS